MSTNVSSEAARQALRRDHDVRLVTVAEEGSAAATLPAGVYGFTGSPVLASPLFANRRYRNFEVHCLPSGVCLIGFVSPPEASQLTHPTSDTVTVKIYPDAEGDATAIVSIPYDRIAQHRQYAIRNAEAIALQVSTGPALSV
jgi:hypothetical protein